MSGLNEPTSHISSIGFSFFGLCVFFPVVCEWVSISDDDSLMSSLAGVPCLLPRYFATQVDHHVRAVHESRPLAPINASMPSSFLPCCFPFINAKSAAAAAAAAVQAQANDNSND